MSVPRSAIPDFIPMHWRYGITLLAGFALGFPAAWLFLQDQAAPHDGGAPPDSRRPPEIATPPSALGSRQGNAAAPPDAAPDGRLARLEGPPPDFTGYLEAEGRSAEALIGAGLATGDNTLIAEAIAADPDNPQALFLGVSGEAGTEAERLAWANRLRALQPDNAYASYLLASEMLKAGDLSGMKRALQEAVAQGALNDFHAESMLAMEAAYLGAGEDLTTAKVRSTFGLPMSQLNHLGKLSEALRTEMENAEPGAAAELRAAGASMGARLSQAPSGLLISELVGLSVEARFLKGMADDAPTGYGRPAAEVRQDIERQRAEITDLIRNNNEVMLENLSPEELAHYAERTRVLGEREAQSWANRRSDSP
ncbi:MAG: hypothetical protein R3F11_20430 [Verrucomicrobiales bacterium]